MANSKNLFIDFSFRLFFLGKHFLEGSHTVIVSVRRSLTHTCRLLHEVPPRAVLYSHQRLSEKEPQLVVVFHFKKISAEIYIKTNPAQLFLVESPNDQYSAIGSVVSDII